MASIYDLSNYDIYRLQTIHPVLSTGWLKTLYDIMPKVDPKIKQIICDKVLLPRGITYDPASDSYQFTRFKTLQEVVATSKYDSKELGKAIANMSRILKTESSEDNPVDILEITDRIEAVLSFLGGIVLDPEQNEYKVAVDVKKAFLNDLAEWIETADLKFEKGVRGLSNAMIKSYFKDVFLKHQLLGWDFKYWDAEDEETMIASGLPKSFIPEMQKRKLLIVETRDYWFLIGPTEKPTHNPFSMGRFLKEDVEFGRDGVFLYHVVVPKSKVADARMAKVIINQINRIYTLDKGVSEHILNYVRDIKRINSTILKAYLKKPLINDGRQIDEIINSRIELYEKELIGSILSKLPRILISCMGNSSDEEYLDYQLFRILQTMKEDIEVFRLQPLSQYAKAPELTIAKIGCMNMFVKRVRPTLCNQSLSNSEKTLEITKPLQELTRFVQEVQENEQYLNQLKCEIIAYESDDEPKTWWRKIFIRKPKYTIQEVQDSYQELYADFFMSVVKLAKEQKEQISYYEFDFGTIINESFRHYGFAGGKFGVDRLPTIIRLLENRKQFDFEKVCDEINAI